MATASHIFSTTIHTFPPPQKPSILLQSPSFFKLPATSSTKFPAASATNSTSQINLTRVNAVPSTSISSSTTSSTAKFYGICYVVRDDVDTDQIIPAKYSALNPSNSDDYKELGSYALTGLPNSYPLRFVEENGVKSKYSIIIAGNNFGCGSSKEHATVALGAAGARAVVAESYDGVFFMNSNSSGVVLALESEVRICEEFKTGDVATIDVGERILVNRTTGKVYQLKVVADAKVDC